MHKVFTILVIIMFLTAGIIITVPSFSEFFQNLFINIFNDFIDILDIKKELTLTQSISKEISEDNKNEDSIISLIEKEILGYRLYITKITANGTEKELQDMKNLGMSQESVIKWFDIDLDKYTQRIGQYLTKLHYPKQAVNNLAFVIVNIKPDNLDKYKIQLPDNSFYRVEPFFTMGGSHTLINSKFGIIVLNQELSFNFDSTLVHELGHHLSYFLTQEEKEQYYALRGIPKETAWITNKWHFSPMEDFAEVYKSTFEPATLYSGAEEAAWKISSGFGELMPPFFGVDPRCNPLNKSDNDVEVQKCRKNAIAQLTTKDDAIAFFYRSPYISSINQNTEQFIDNFLLRLSH
jgi:hypothetical protein